MRASLLSAALALGCALAAGRAPASPAVIPLTLPSGHVFQTELMVNDEDRAMGLMFRPSLGADRALLFVFDQLDFHAIWMKNCKFPIDIVWLDEGKKVVHVAARVPPCKADPCPSYQPMRRAAYVVEMNAGAANKEKVVVGSTLGFTLPR
jgi:uncharacterized membrane protein (UPF0127 family)